jgi:hypothetical protein
MQQTFLDHRLHPFPSLRNFPVGVDVTSTIGTMRDEDVAIRDQTDRPVNKIDCTCNRLSSGGRRNPKDDGRTIKVISPKISQSLIKTLLDAVVVCTPQFAGNLQWHKCGLRQN